MRNADPSPLGRSLFSPRRRRGIFAVAALLLAFGACSEPPEETPAAAPPPVEVRAVPEPDLTQLDPLVAERLRQRRRWQEAIENADEVTAEQRADAFGELGNLYQAYRLVDAAEAAYANARSLAPEDYRWPFYLGHLYWGENRIAEAEKAFEDSLELRPDHVAARVRLGEVLLDQNRTAEAEEQFERALGLAPETPAALFGLGQIAAGRGDAKTAVEDFRRVLEIDPGATEAHYPLALAYRQLGDQNSAEKELAQRGEGEVRLEDPLMRHLFELSEGYRLLQKQGGDAFEAKRYEAATEAFAAAVAADPLAPVARRNLAAALLAQDHAAEAADQLAVALKLAPGDTEELRRLAGLRLRLRDREAAIPLLEEVLQKEPADASSRLSLALALEESGRLDEALAAYRGVLAADPDRTAARLGEASALLRLSRHAEARQRLEAGLAASGGRSGELANALAQVLASAPEAEVRDGRRALELAEGLFQARADAEHAETLAMALAETGDFLAAARLQRGLVQSAEKSGQKALAEYFRADLELYQQGQPCRAPWNRSLPARTASPPAPGAAGK